MDATAVRIFENETARKWADGLASRDNLWIVREALKAVIYTDCFLDDDRAFEGLAACEVVARLKGNWGLRDESTSTIDAWVEAHPLPVPDDLVKIAADAIDRTLTPESDLYQSWTDLGVFDAWEAALIDLKRRVLE